MDDNESRNKASQATYSMRKGEAGCRVGVGVSVFPHYV